MNHLPSTVPVSEPALIRPFCVTASAFLAVVAFFAPPVTGYFGFNEKFGGLKT